MRTAILLGMLVIFAHRLLLLRLEERFSPPDPPAPRRTPPTPPTPPSHAQAHAQAPQRPGEDAVGEPLEPEARRKAEEELLQAYVFGDDAGSGSGSGSGSARETLGPARTAAAAAPPGEADPHGRLLMGSYENESVMCGGVLSGTCIRAFDGAGQSYQLL